MTKKVVVEKVVDYRCFDSITHERIYPGDLVRITFRNYFRGLDENGKKIFANRYDLIKRSTKSWPK